MKEFFTNFLQNLGLAWWVKIDTTNPRCTYYFGPFLSQQNAKQAKAGYVEDLMAEQAQGISVTIMRGELKQKNLTIFEDQEEQVDPERMADLSSQIF